MTTPNTIKRYDNYYYEMDERPEGEFVKYSDHLAALSRAREEARREALEEAVLACVKRRLLHLRSLESVTDVVRGHEAADCADAVGALIHPTPQGETKEQQP